MDETSPDSERLYSSGTMDFPLSMLKEFLNNSSASSGTTDQAATHLKKPGIPCETPTHAQPAHHGTRCVRLFNETFLVEFVPRSQLEDHGECEDPQGCQFEIPRIRIRDDLSELDTLVTLVHEMAHGCNWRWLSEDWVSEMSEHIGRSLYQLGYRRVA